MKTKQISDSLYCFTGSDEVNVYLFRAKKLIIDTGNPIDREDLRSAIEKVMLCSDVQHVILTHFHYDHAGNLSMFSQAKIYASSEEIAALAQFGAMLTFNRDVLNELRSWKIRVMQDYLDADF